MTKNAEAGFSRAAVRRGHAAERYTSLILATFLCTPLTAQLHPTPAGGSMGGNPAVTIALIDRNLTERVFQLRYQIRNGSEHDIWLCDVMDVGHTEFEICWNKDGPGFLIRRRSHVEQWYVLRNPPLSRYVRLRAGESWAESLLLPIPLRPHSVVASEVVPADVEYIERVALEIGYYEESAARFIRESLAQEEKGYLNEQFFVYHRSGPALQREGILRLAVNDAHVRATGSEPGRRAPNLSNCTRLAISYEPSMLAYFFPYADQQSLLSSAEKDYLESAEVTRVDDPKSLKAFAYEISQGICQGLIAQGAKAHIVCFENDNRCVSFDLYHDAAVTDEGNPFYYTRFYEEASPNLGQLMPQIRPFALRLRCARNLVDLNERIRFYLAKEQTYPEQNGWCDVIVHTWRAWYIDDFVFRPFICPGAPEGKSHYAMNPNCKPDSPADTVLLFETKAGWNQHGGPELFSFTNHDPRGGCVLLNDGTVKFIRSEDDLSQLRWK